MDIWKHDFWKYTDSNYKFTIDEKEIIRKTKFNFVNKIKNYPVYKFEYIYTELFKEDYNLSNLTQYIYTKRRSNININLLKFLITKNALKNVNDYNFTEKLYIYQRKQLEYVNKTYAELITILLENGYKLYKEHNLILFAIDYNSIDFINLLIENGINLKENVDTEILLYIKNNNQNFLKTMVENDVDIETLFPKVLYHRGKILPYELQLVILDKFPKLATTTFKEIIKFNKYNKLSTPDKQTPKVIKDYEKYNINFYTDINYYIKYFGLGYLKYVKQKYNEFNIEETDLLNIYLTARIIHVRRNRYTYHKIDIDVIKFLIDNGVLKNVDELDRFPDDIREVILTY